MLSAARHACSGRSKSPSLASKHGIAFRPARASQDNRKPTFRLFCSIEPRPNNTRFKLSLFLQRRTRLCVCGPLPPCVCVHCLCVCVLCVRVCALVCWNPTFQLFRFFFCSACCCCRCCAYHVVCIAPSLKLSSPRTLWWRSLRCGSHGTTAIAHQVLPFVAATDGASVCVCVCLCVCVSCFLWERTHKSQERAWCKDAATGKHGDTNPPLTSPGFVKATAQPRLQQQQRYSSITTALLLGGHTIVIRTHDVHKNPYIPVFFYSSIRS